MASFTFILFGCANFSQTESSQYVADVPDNVDKTKDADIHSREIEHYEAFLSGDECAYDEGWMFDIDHVVKGSGCTNEGDTSKYAYYDSDKDGQLELHVQSSYFYYILQYRNNRLESLKALDIETGSDKIEWTIIPEENGTENVENNNDAMEHYEAFLMGKECAYIRPTKEPDKHYATRYAYFDSDEYGFEDKEVTMSEWNELTREYFEIGTDEIEWVILFAATD